MKTYFNDKTVKFLYDPQINKFRFQVNQVGAQAASLIEEADFTYSDSNSIFVSDTTGNDSTGAGTQANPYKTIKKGINSTTAAKGYVVVLDSATYSESDLDTATYTNFLGLYAATSGAPYLSRRTLDYTPSDSNSIFIKKTGSDANAGTQAAPVLTISGATGAISKCTAAKQNMVIMDSGTYEETGFELTGNAINIYAALGMNPTIEMTVNTSNFSITENVSETTFHDAGSEYISSAILDNGDIFIAYRDSVDSKGKYIVLSSSDWSTVKSETIFYNAALGSISVSVLSNGNVFIAYMATTGKYIVLSSSDWSTVKSETTFHGGSSTHIGSAVLDSGDIFIAYCDAADSNKGKYIVLSSSDWSTVKSETTFHDQYSYCNKVGVLDDGNIFIAYQDPDDSNKGKYIVLSSSDWSTVKSETTFHNAALGAISVSVLSNGNVFIAYNATTGKYIVLSSSDWSTVKSETTFHGDSSTYIGSAVLDSGDIFIAYCDAADSNKGKYCVLRPSFRIIKNSVSSKLEGIIFKSKAGNKYYCEKFIEGSANIYIKWCTIECNESTDNIIFKAIYSNSEVNLYNCIIRDNDAGIYTLENKSVIHDSQFYRNNKGYAIDIDGAAASSGDIIVEHCDIFNNYGSIHFENNHGTNEIIKNNIFHDNDNGFDAETAASFSDSVCTDTNINVTDGADVVRMNPLYINEGASDPDDIDLDVKVRIVGDYADSPAKDLADDTRNAGSINLQYIGEDTSWTEITIPKPDKFGPPYIKFLASSIVKRDGSVSSEKKGQTEYLPIKWKGLENTYAEDVLDMWLAESPLVRVYPDPVTYPDDYDLFYKIWDSNMSEGAEFWPLSRTGVSDIEIMLARGYE